MKNQRWFDGANVVSGEGARRSRDREAMPKAPIRLSPPL